MSDNIYGQKLAESPPELPTILTDALTAETGADDTANLVVIPINQEIASDFELIGYRGVIRTIEEVLTQRGKQRNVMLYGENGVGKEHPYSLTVSTPIGDRLWGDLQIGDVLFGRNGCPTRITGRHEQGVKPIYRMTFDDGSSTLAGLDHLWRVRGHDNHHKRADCEWETLTTAMILKRGVMVRHEHPTRQWEVPRIEPVQYPYQEVPVDPYTLGVWIGDGSVGSSRYSKPDIEIVERIRTVYRVTENFGSDCPCWYISDISDGLKSVELWNCRSYERFVPKMYLCNSAAVRTEILRGILDTDGSADQDGTVEFSSSSKKLADDVAWLVRSLAGKAHQSTKTNCGYKNGDGTFVPCRDSHKVILRLPDGFQVFYLSRKQERVASCQSRYLTRWIDSIEYDHDESAMCVTVDASDSLYLVNDFIPTHNTAIIHGLVQRKNRGDLSTHMFKRMFDRLNSSRLLHMDDVAEINRQFDQALEEFGRYDVMVIENFYTLMTYLKAKNANAVMVGFLEALSRRRLQSIITCNGREKSLIVNEIPEIHEFFAPVPIPEPSDDELLQILRGVHVAYEARYAIDLPDATLRTICDLTQKYRNGLEGWAQPGRALILLDRGISQFSVRMNSKSPELTALEAEITNAENELDSIDPGTCTSQADILRVKALQQRLEQIRPQVAKMRGEWIEATAPIQALQTEKAVLDKKLHGYLTRRWHLKQLRNDPSTDVSKIDTDASKNDALITKTREAIKEKDDELGKINLSDRRDHIVTSAAIAETYAEMSGIPTAQLNQDERERVLRMEAILGERVYGQPQALSMVANAVRREKAKLTEEETTPKGSFLFLGPSGVGKTETGKALAWFLTGSEKNLIRFDMSEYMEKHTVSRLIGAPPGYAGYEEGGTLTNAVLAKPKSVVMFDESEKAHEDIFKVMLSVLSDGRLTDGRGTTVDFSETIIILTSNLGAEYFIDDSLTFEQAEQAALKVVRNWQSNEFIGRLDGIVCFHRLELPMLVRVAKRRIDAINRGIGTNQQRLDFPDHDVESFCTRYQNPHYGARPILQAMKSTLEGDLAVKILERPEGGGVFHAAFNNDALIVTFDAATQ